jgi:hypothetical protein
MSSEIPPVIFDVFAIATAVGVLIQAGVLVGMFLGLRKFQAKIEKMIDPAMEHALPLLATSRTTLEDLAPKLKVISENLAVVSETLKSESANLKGSVDDVLSRTRAQTARVDEMVSGTLDGISQAAAVIHQGMETPMRKIHGVFNGLKAGFETYRSQPRTKPVRPVSVVEEPVIVLEEVVVASLKPLV